MSEAGAWITTEQLALEFGITPASIRTNWPRQYGIRPVRDRWLLTDVEKVRLTRRLRNSTRTRKFVVPSIATADRHAQTHGGLTVSRAGK
ncbi:MAG TPA: hypothetical protein PLF91_14560 [Mycolicibacterium fallax]|nr:hypothetical protein [Mycolicibacterium fallax]